MPKVNISTSKHQFFSAVVLSLIFISLTVFLAPSPVGAQVNKMPEFNPICWDARQCCDARSQFVQNNSFLGDVNHEHPDCTSIPNDATGDNIEGWVHDSECAGKWGKCLPTGVTQTEIAFGGRREFLHLGDFLIYIYRYALGVASIIAVTLIIVAGFEWATSGGNAETISGAKHRITSAIAGLFIAYLSYFILNTVNPALINLRLPQAYMIRPQSAVPQFCATASSSPFYGVVGSTANAAAGADDQVSPITAAPDPSHPISYINPPTVDAFFCGKRFFLGSGNGSQTCFGDYCPGGQVCVDALYVGKSPKQRYYCSGGIMGGQITGSVGGLSGVVVDNDVKLIALCKDGSIKGIGSATNVTVQRQPQSYILPVGNLDVCGGRDSTVGFYLGVEGNDESVSGFGKEGTPFTTSFGIDDWYAVGQEAPDSHACDFNLAPLHFTLTSQGTTLDCANNFNCTCSQLSDKVKNQVAIKSDNFISHLITYDELRKGYSCDMVLDRSNFPAAPNGWVVKFDLKTGLQNIKNSLIDATKCGED